MDEARVAELESSVSSSGYLRAAQVLSEESDAIVAATLVGLPAALSVPTLFALADEKRERVLEHVPAPQREQWLLNHSHPPGSVGRLMEIVHAVFAPGDSVASVVERLREIVRDTLITYGFVVDEEGKLVGVLIFRDLLFASPDQRIEQVMIRDPDWLDAEADIESAMRIAVLRHYPEYPVVDRRGQLLGLVRGQTLFEQHAFQLSAQAGQMVGVEQDERLATPWRRSLRFRQPWLQLNLLTAFAAGAVVALFQDTIDQIVLLAAFLPVVAGQTGNTGSQALAVTVRSMTLGELTPERARGATLKEMLLGTLNGAAVGITAGAAMYFYAASQQHAAPSRLAIVVFLTMVIGCMVSGVSGTLVPRMLRRLGADPATASSILLTTATDVVSMGVLLMLAGLLVL